jgi:hypothetical protein
MRKPDWKLVLLAVFWLAYIVWLIRVYSVCAPSF